MGLNCEVCRAGGYGQMPPGTIAALDKHFPDSKRGSEVDKVIYRKLSSLGFTPQNTLFADSTCPDEINRDDPDQDVVLLMQKRWGETFPLGGLGGVPFTGKTGWGAFSSHCPDDGNIIVLFAPHVGIDKMGVVGNINRPGQCHTTTACGAAIGAYKAVSSDPNSANFQNGHMDHQMDFIKNLLQPHVRDIQSGKDEQVALAYKMYECIYKYIDQLVNLNFGGPNSKLVLVGGIMVNCDGEGTDQFKPLKFEVRDKQGRVTDFYQECFQK